MQGQWLNVCFHYADSNEDWCPEYRIIYAFSSEEKCTYMIESGHVAFLFPFFWISSHMRTSLMLWTQCELINFLLLVCQSDFSVIINHRPDYDNSISLSLFIVAFVLVRHLYCVLIFPCAWLMKYCLIRWWKVRCWNAMFAYEKILGKLPFLPIHIGIWPLARTGTM